MATDPEHPARAQRPYGRSPRTVLAEAQDRCRAAGLAPDRIASYAVPPEELALRREAAGELLAIALPRLDSISAGLAGVAHALVLADRDGIILAAAGNSGMLAENGYRPGYDWTERRMGPNAIGTALAAGEPVAVEGAAHWSHAHQRFAAVAAPVLAPGTAGPIGCIGLATPLVPGTLERLVIVTEVAASIGRELETSEAARRIGRDLERWRRITEAVRRSEERYRATFDGAPVGLGLVDSSGAWVEANARLREALGFPTDGDASAGPALADLLDDSAAADLRRVLTGEAPQGNFVLRRDRDGRRAAPLHLRVARLPDDTAVPGYVVVVVEESRDGGFDGPPVTGPGRDSLLHTFTHEIRTPLASILGYCDILEGGAAGPLAPGQRQHLARIRASASVILDLINRLLDLARIDAGKEEVRALRFDARTLVRDAAALVAPLVDEAGLEFRIVTPDAAVEVETDPDKLRQVLLNLLSNAVNFTDAGTVELRLLRDDDAIRFEVADTGPGIPVEDRERIFHPFERLEHAGNRRRRGSGLGLSVARNLVRLLGGEITVASAVGQGSTFSVRLPLQRAGAHRGA